MSASRPKCQITCEVCGCPCYSALKNRDICRDCHRREISTRCARCGVMKHHVAEETGLCPHCTEILTRPKKVKCSVCGQTRSSERLRRAICKACCKKERNGCGLCVGCGKLKVIFIRAQRLCKQCYAHRRAPKVLLDYVTTFTTPYRYNKTLFDLFATSIEWDSVTARTNHQLRVFGRFLQTHQLGEPLTWETIEEALPALGPTACLLRLGHLLVTQGKLESREGYLERRTALRPISHAPEDARLCLQAYTGWLWERRITPLSVRNHLEAIVAFWSWCAQHGIQPPAGVQSSVVDKHLLTLYWQWQCSACGGTLPFEPRDRRAPKVCTHCGAIGSVTKGRRYAQNTVRNIWAQLQVFFDWAKMNRLVVVNPIRRKIAAPRRTICHYPVDVLKRLCAYVTAPEADPVEALVLYLILFHALSTWELRHAKMPALLPLHEDVSLPTLAEAYYLIVPKPAPSRGHRSPGRPDSCLSFPPSAERWLKPLLERAEGHRRQIVGAFKNPYLLVTPGRARHNTPVSRMFVWEVVRRASLRVLGVACNPKTLRKTVGVMFADRAGAGVLRWLGWDDQQAFAYTWAMRQMIHPQPLNSVPTGEPYLSATPVVLPAPQGGHMAAAQRALRSDR
jgi:hypothetical protein